jgi:hypothetical protein
MTRGITEAEFRALCVERMNGLKRGGSFPKLDTSLFLWRCCELGLLTCEEHPGGRRYYPTPELIRAVGLFQPGE